MNSNASSEVRSHYLSIMTEEFYSEFACWVTQLGETNFKIKYT